MPESAYSPRSRMRSRRLLALVFALMMTCLTLVSSGGEIARAAPPAADAAAVLKWNQITYRVFGERAYAPPVQGLLGGFVATAVFDAVNTIEGGYESYVPQAPAAPGASVDAAVATAAHDVLVALAPTTDWLEAEWAASLASVSDPAARDAGRKVGHDAAAAFMATRVGDGRFDPRYKIEALPVPQPGVWDPPATGAPPSGMTAAWMGFVTPLAVPNQTWIPLGGPDPLASTAYAKDFAEVKAKGAKIGSTRTAKQTQTALFFTDNPFPQYNGALRDRFVRHHGPMGGPAVEAARAFAVADMAMADAIIVGWRAKYDFRFWRPDEAIRRADTDGNPATVRQADWEPLWPNPAYGDYVSGHALATGAFQQAMAKLFGRSRIDLYISSSTPGAGPTRHYQKAAKLKRDTENARIWLGLHFRKAMDDGNRVGRKTAEFVIAHEFRPVC